MTTELQRLWDNAWNAAQERQWLYGRLGFIGDSGGTITLQVPHRKDFVYVRMGFAGDRGVDIARRRPGVQLRPNLPVKMRRENGVLVIYEADYALMENDLNNPIDESGVTLHYHEFVNLSDVPSTYVGQTGKIVAVNATEDALEFVDHVAPDPLLINTIQAKTAFGITFLDSNLDEMLILTNDDAIEIPGEFATIDFTGTPGGDGEGITYLDSFSTLRFGLFFPGSDIVALANRASNGVVHIRANDATAGELGETTAAVFEHDQIQLLPSGGNVGVGTNTFPAWPSVYRVLQLGDTISFTENGPFVQVNNNFYYDGTDFRYIANGYATRYLQTIGRHIFQRAPSGLAGATFSFLEGLRIREDGNVGIGNSAPDALLTVGDSGGTSGEIQVQSNGGRIGVFEADDAGSFVHIGTLTNHTFQLVQNDSTRMSLTTTDVRVESGYNLSVGVSAASGIFHAHDGNGGAMLVSKTGVNATAQTIIPNAVGDVVRGVIGFYILEVGTNAESSILGPIGPGGSMNITVGADTFQVSVGAGGAMTIQRTVGTGTADVTFFLVWL